MQLILQLGQAYCGLHVALRYVLDVTLSFAGCPLCELTRPTSDYFCALCANCPVTNCILQGCYVQSPSTHIHTVLMIR